MSFGKFKPRKSCNKRSMWQVKAPATAQAEPATTSEGVPQVAPQGNAAQAPPEPVPHKRSPAHYPSAALQVNLRVAYQVHRNSLSWT